MKPSLLNQTDDIQQIVEQERGAAETAQGYLRHLDSNRPSARTCTETKVYTTTYNAGSQSKW